MATFKGKNNNKCGEIRNPYTLLVGMQISTTIKESSMKVPQKAKDRTAI
jgi:hypothetical protein